jgi:hypothetical protein
MTTDTTTTVAETAAAPDVERAAATAAGLRSLAALIAGHPHLAPHVRYSAHRLLVPLRDSDDARATLIAFARAGQASGAAVTEFDDVTYAGVDVTFGPITLHVYARVELVHDVTRVVEYTPRSILAEVVA